MKGLEQAKLITDINQECDRIFNGLKQNNLSIYLDTVVELSKDKGLKATVAIATHIHPSRQDEIQEILKDKRFTIPVEVRIHFLDGGELIVRFGKKEDAANRKVNC